ncbi:DUF6796 family protein [Porphyromonas pogonae]|uniref:DUF6796 family protein n=1 Tax=Porphyromonas pogonae TaxID=867595 RepID=UPI002E7A013D|nr:DUF6796 family protein [Porphyromonas pogonae]
MNRTTYRQLMITGYIGLLGSLLMFAGDMLLYFTSKPVDNIEQEILSNMGGVPLGRMYAGGLVGPLAVCMYLIGFYHLYLAVREPQKMMAKIMLAILCIAIIIGGTYHAFFPAFGIVARQGHPELIDPLMNYAAYLGIGMFILVGIGLLIFAGIVLAKKTIYPRWIVIVNPMVTLWLGFLWQYLPQPYLMIIGGGWNSLVFGLLLAASLIVLRVNRNNLVNESTPITEV